MENRTFFQQLFSTLAEVRLKQNEKIIRTKDIREASFIFSVEHALKISSAIFSAILLARALFRSDNSFYPGEPEVSHNSEELETIQREIEDTNFHLESEYITMVIHEDVIQKGHALPRAKIIILLGNVATRYIFN